MAKKRKKKKKINLHCRWHGLVAHHVDKKNVDKLWAAHLKAKHAPILDVLEESATNGRWTFTCQYHTEWTDATDVTLSRANDLWEKHLKTSKPHALVRTPV